MMQIQEESLTGNIDDTNSACSVSDSGSEASLVSLDSPTRILDSSAPGNKPELDQKSPYVIKQEL